MPVDRRGSYLEEGDIIYRIIFYYKDPGIPQTWFLDLVSKLPVNDYAIVFGSDRCYLALDFMSPYTITDPKILDFNQTGAKVWVENVQDIFQTLRECGPPVGSYQYNTVSFIGEHRAINLLLL